jgi:PAS domain S-box-containing protein
VKKTYKKTEEKLTSEGTELRQPVAELEGPATDHMQAEQLLQKIEGDKLAILNSISELVAYQDTEYRILWTNKAAAESVGLTPAQLVGRHCYEIWPQRNKPCEGCPVAKARQTGKPQKAEITTPDGRTWSIRGYPVLDANDLVVGTVEVTLDVTERKKAEQALADEATRRRILVDQSLDGIVILDDNAKVYEANRQFAEMLGYTPEEIRELHTWDWDTRWSREELLEMGRKVDETGFHLETCHRRKDGTIIDVEISVNGAVIAGQKLIFCVCRDITERKQAEQALKASQEMFTKAFRTSPDPMVITSLRDGKFIEVNDSLTRVLGFTREETVGHTSIEMGIWESPEDRTRVAQMLRQQGEVHKIEIKFRNKWGESRDGLFSANLIEIGGEPCMIALTTDITERKQAEEKLNESEERFRIASQIASDVVYERDLQTGIATFYGDIDSHFGYEPGEYPRTMEGWREHVHPEDLAWIDNQIIYQMEPGVPHSIEYRMRRKDGTYMTWLDKVTVICDEKTGKPLKFLGVATDITERKQAEQALQSEKNKLQSVIGAIEYALTIQDKDYNIIYQNEPSRVSSGGDRVGEKCYRAYEGRDKICDGCPVAKAFKDGKSHTWERKVVKPSGEVIFWENTANPVRDASGEIVTCLEVGRNITERKRAEEALRDSEEKTRKMFESVSCGISVVDLNGVITEVNRRTVEIHGLSSRDEILGKSAFDIVAPRDREKIARNMRQALKRGPIRDQEYNLLKSDGSEFPAELSTSALKDASGKLIGHITVSRDITERKQAEQALQAEKNKLQSLIDALEDDLSIQDKDYNIIYQNKPSRVSSGGDRVGEKCYRAYEGKDEVSDGCPVKKAFKDGKSHTSERRVVKPSGEVIFWENTANPIRDAGGNIVSCLEVARNITERKRSEEREKELQKELLLSSRLASIGELAAGVAHQINNPLTGILGFSQRLLKKSTNEESSQDLERIHTEAERAAKVVQNLLTFARRRQPHKQYSDINEILESALELRAYELKTSNIELITNLTPKLPEIMLDFYQIQEVFLNIILNAEQAMTEANNGGKLTIKTKERKGLIRTTFTDDGPGIPAERLDKIFDPFFTTKGEKGGTGLGLSVCHGIITEHGGKIYARSKPGKGTAFFVELPLPAR